MPMPAQLSQQRFPLRKRSLATSIGVMSNYLGWFLASAVTPRVVVDAVSLENFLFYQAVFSLLALAIFLVFYRPALKRRPTQGVDPSFRDVSLAREMSSAEMSGQNVVARCRAIW